MKGEELLLLAGVGIGGYYVFRGDVGKKKVKVGGKRFFPQLDLPEISYPSLDIDVPRAQGIDGSKLREWVNNRFDEFGAGDLVDTRDFVPDFGFDLEEESEKVGTGAGRGVGAVITGFTGGFMSKLGEAMGEAYKGQVKWKKQVRAGLNLPSTGLTGVEFGPVDEEVKGPGAVDQLRKDVGETVNDVKEAVSHAISGGKVKDKKVKNKKGLREWKPESDVWGSRRLELEKEAKMLALGGAT